VKACVTGAAEGLGRALTEHLLSNGCEVLAIDRNEEGLNELLIGWPDGCETKLADLSDEKSVAGLFEEAGDGSFDLVVLNAGVSATGRFEDISAEAYERLLCVNTNAPMILSSGLVRDGRMAKGGTIVFISSLSHVTGYPGASVYGASKDAIAVYAKSVRKSFKQRDVNILIVFPGPIRTAHAERHAPQGANADKRMRPEDLATHILEAVGKRKKVLYPGIAAKVSRIVGRIAPATMTMFMRRIIFDKLGGPIY